MNTNETIHGLLKEILIDRHLEGEELDKRIVPIAACNPYKSKRNYLTKSAGMDGEA